MNEQSKRPGCLKSCLFGCGGVTALLLVFVLITAGLAALKMGDQQPVERDLEPALAAADMVLDPTRPGLLILDMGQGEMEIEPTPAGGELSVHVQFDDEVHDLLESYEVAADSSWTYELRLHRTMPGMQALFRQLMGGETNARVKVRIPPDMPLGLEIRMKQGGFEADLGGLWITTADVYFSQGGFALTVKEPLKEPMERLTIHGRMGGFAAMKLGNASPRLLVIDTSMGGADVDLQGAWLNDCDVTLRSSMGGVSVQLPDGVRTTGLEELRPNLLQTATETPLPLLNFDVKFKMGEIEVR